MYYTIGGELYHHGILGQRWGKRNGPPYPLSPGDHSASEKKQAKRGVSTLSDYFKNKKKKKQQKKALEKARATKATNAQKKKTEEERAADRERALKAGSAADILKFQGELSAQQLQEAINRISNENKLREMSAKDVKSVTDKVDSIVNKIDKARGWTEKGINAYNTAAKIMNTFSDNGDLPIIGEKKSDAKAKDYDNLLKKLQVENSELRNKYQDALTEAQKIKNKEAKFDLKEKKKKAKAASA